MLRTGLRIGEAVALTWADIDLGQRSLRVRRRLYRGRLDRPKSKYGRRELRLSEGLARSLWTLRGPQPEEALVFPSSTGGHLDASNVMGRVLKPAVVEAGLGEWIREPKKRPRAETWVGFHTFRHTCATSLIVDEGRRLEQVQVYLGHQDIATTRKYYVHLYGDDLPDRSSILDRAERTSSVLDQGANGVRTGPTEMGREATAAGNRETA
jgi:integrase